MHAQQRLPFRLVGIPAAERAAQAALLLQAGRVVSVPKHTCHCPALDGHDAVKAVQTALWPVPYGHTCCVHAVVGGSIQRVS